MAGLPGFRSNSISNFKQNSMEKLDLQPGSLYAVVDMNGGILFDSCVELEVRYGRKHI